MGVIVPILTAILIWWSTTALVLWLVNREGIKRRTVGFIATALMVSAMVAVVALRDQTDGIAAYAGFGAGIILWGWHETLFLLGFISGPRKTPCPEGLTTRRRFVVSAQALIHHEALIAIHAVILAMISFSAQNPVAAWTFFTLWVLRLSAKLLIFFGAPNIAQDFLPARLGYLGSYFNKSTHKLAAYSLITAVTIGLMALCSLAGLAEAGSFHRTVFVLLATLTALAVFEHLALVVRLPDRILWSWTLRAPNHHDSHHVASTRTSL